MQYGVEYAPYQRVGKRCEVKKDKKAIDIRSYIELIIYIFSSFLISRVFLINLIAPFGLALLVSVCREKKGKIILCTGLGVIIGYISLFNSKITELPIYISISISIVILSYIFTNKKSISKFFVFLTTILVEIIFYLIIFKGMASVFSIVTAIFETSCIIPIHLVLHHTLKCFEKIKKNRERHLFLSEELISIAITISLIIAGTWGINLYGVSLRNILALTFILIISYIKGSPFGAACGVAMGFIVGMSGNNMILFIGVYAICGLIPGLFKVGSKYFSGLSFIVVFSIIKLYSGIGGEFKIFEALLALMIFLLVSDNNYNKMSLEFDWEKQKQDFNEGYSDKIKDVFLGKLSSFTGVLYNMSNVLNGVDSNEILTEKNKSSFLIEGLADRLCKNCALHSSCWKREIYYTYSAFGELIQNCQEKNRNIPDELNRKCIRKGALIKNTQELVNSFIADEMYKSKLNEGKNILASQISNMASSLDKIVEEFNTNIFFDEEIEVNIRRILDKNRIKYIDILCMKNEAGRLTIKANLEACGGKHRCLKEIIPILNSGLNKCMCVEDDGCSIDKKTGECSITFQETPKYYIVSEAAIKCKYGEEYSGDSYSFCKLPDGSYMTIICDGMGSGPTAGEESGTAVKLIERFTKAGFSKEAAINSVNSIMTLKATSVENFSTLDLSSIDLYTGEIAFIKIGATNSYIKSSNEVYDITSRSLPMGVLDKIEMDVVKKSVKNGDIIVMLSDGVVDTEDKNQYDVHWIEEYLKDCTIGNPKELAEEILRKAISLEGEKPKDDMTVIVSKIYSLY